MMRSRQGFSLIELLVVLGLLSVATGLAVTTFFRMNDQWDFVRTGAEFDERADKIFDYFHDDAETALSAQVSSVAIAHNDRESEGLFNEFYGSDFASDTLTLPVFAQLGSDRNLIAAKVRYYIERNTRSAVLRRQVTSIDGEFSDENPGIPVDDGVISLDFQFPNADGTGWVGRWGRPGTPPMIRVNILMIDPGDPTTQASRTAVFRIHQ